MSKKVTRRYRLKYTCKRKYPIQKLELHIEQDWGLEIFDLYLEPREKLHHDRITGCV